MGELDLGDSALYRVQKMAWARKRVDGKLTDDKTTLVYNSRITLGDIPPEALDYIVNGKPAIEWIIERYQVTTDKDSGIVNDPNDWATEHDDPAYILNLVKRIVRVSVETVRIVKGSIDCPVCLPIANQATNRKKARRNGLSVSLRLWKSGPRQCPSQRTSPMQLSRPILIPSFLIGMESESIAIPKIQMLNRYGKSGKRPTK
jgi:hypothetical protein